MLCSLSTQVHKGDQICYKTRYVLKLFTQPSQYYSVNYNFNKCNWFNYMKVYFLPFKITFTFQLWYYNYWNNGGWSNGSVVVQSTFCSGWGPQSINTELNKTNSLEKPDNNIRQHHVQFSFYPHMAERESTGYSIPSEPTTSICEVSIRKTLKPHFPIIL